MSQKHYTTITEEVAEATGYERVTADYFLPEEQEMLDHAIEQLRGKTFVLVAPLRYKWKIQIWRKSRECAFGGGHDDMTYLA